MKRTLLLILFPALLLAILYILSLGHRSDYAGHYMAGFGGTLFWIMAGFHILRDKQEPMSTGSLVLVITLACIAFGTLLEATTFRLAKFDEVDYFNQNLGAILAGCSSIAALPETGVDSPVILPSMIIAMLFLAAGFVYAFS